jgi:putative addiction module component (TIGR02574 family)
MSVPENQLFESALSLPQADRADLAFQLLQTLTPPGDELSTADFAAEIHERVAANRRGEIKSFSLEETRAIMNQRLSQDLTSGSYGCCVQRF